MSILSLINDNTHGAKKPYCRSQYFIRTDIVMNNIFSNRLKVFYRGLRRQITIDIVTNYIHITYILIS